MLWLWAWIGLVLTNGYIFGHVLLRNSRDGHPALERLIHVAWGRRQEEHAGRGGPVRQRVHDQRPGCRSAARPSRWRVPLRLGPGRCDPPKISPKVPPPS